MTRNLLAITPDRFSEELIIKAISHCKEKKSELIILIVTDNKNINKTAENFKNLSNLGMSSSKKIRESLTEHNNYLIEEDITEIKQRLSEAKINYQEIRAEGDFSEKVIEIVNQFSPENLFVCERNVKSSFSRFIYGSVVDQLKEKCNCNVVIT